ncbi:MAG: ABC transporter substrate-binding protein [Dehalococcoidia bacterium]|nr:ABC transporter substrate-binding protein [Dehalococcoidia bacterium]
MERNVRLKVIGSVSLIVVLLVTMLVTACAPKSAGEEPIKIGLLANKTGGLAAYGYSHEKVAIAAVDQLNAEGGIAGRSVELYVEDDESKPSVGATKFRKLVENNGVDFVLDSNSSGVAVACCPIAKELNTIYFPCSSATEISGDKGNRYIFQACTNVREECKGAAKFAVDNIGKKWVTVVVDYSWGQANEEAFTTYVTQNGGTVLASIRVPLGTSNWLPYLKGKIPADAEAVYFANFGSDFLCFLRDLYAVRPDIEKLGAVYAISARDPAELGAPAEGLYCLTSYPTRLAGLDTPGNKEYRDIIGVNSDGLEIGTDKYFVLAYDWAVWEPIFALKAAIEKSGWTSKADNPALIETLEGMHFEAGVKFPQGDMYYRAADHATIAGIYVEQIVNGELTVAAAVPASEVVYTSLVDRTKEPF